MYETTPNDREEMVAEMRLIAMKRPLPRDHEMGTSFVD